MRNNAAYLPESPIVYIILPKSIRNRASFTIFAYVSSTAVDMDYDIKDKMEWTIIFIREFGRKYGLSMKQAFNYLSRFKGIDFIDRHYDYVHTQSFASMVDDIAEYCHRHGGALV